MASTRGDSSTSSTTNRDAHQRPLPNSEATANVTDSQAGKGGKS